MINSISLNYYYKLCCSVLKAITNDVTLSLKWQRIERYLNDIPLKEAGLKRIIIVSSTHQSSFWDNEVTGSFIFHS